MGTTVGGRAGRLRRLPILAEQLGLTAILLGYLMVWLPNRAAGLALLGMELAEWLKFLPEVESGVIGPRGVFYLPPVTLSLLMLLTSVGWPRRGATSAWRLLALVVGLLAVPPVEALLGASLEVVRTAGLLGLVALTALAVSLGWLERMPSGWRLALILVVALVGAVWPLVVFREARALVSNLLGTPLGVGPGVWLNGAGHGLVAAGAAWRQGRPARPTKKTMRASSF